MNSALKASHFKYRHIENIIMKGKKAMEPKIYITQTLVNRDMNLKRALEKRISHL